MSEILTLPIDVISIRGGTQSRVALHQDTVADYAEVIRLGGELPPVVVFNDGESTGMWLADGFHRFHAHLAAGAAEIICDVRAGSQRDAILFSAGANVAHGLRRTNDDKRRAVSILLGDEEWSKWSDREIARVCGVGNKFVGDVRASICVPNTDAPAVRVVERNGKKYEQNVSNIGKAEPAPAPPAAKQPDAAAEEARAATPGAATAAMAEPQPADVAPDADSSEQVELTEVDALREQVAELSESLRTTLADNEMMGRVFDADDQLKAAMDEAARQKAIAVNAERTLAAKSGEFIERAKAVTYWQRRAEKAEKQLARLKAAA
ncbi:ParB-like nuclease domain-containing protein [Massilia antarctica]|uniref:ParB-like nuclease domain-containing protein n=1 Tax=Massilia antarctica TaxID=2765360 RepID=A0AA48WIE6_9BURK|nr:ParB N-terminal domain-containing protein [Massilia antarctica]QPI52902.1 ParB-like nuclease domain-containing protein [Massilia antarctica]